MKHSLITPGTTVTLRCVNGGGGSANANNGVGGSGAVTYVRIGPAATITQLPAPGQGGGGGQQLANQVNFVAQQQQHTNGNGGGGDGESGNQVLFRRFPNNNIVQIRRIITQQPQQLQQVAGDLSSSDSSVGFEPSRIKNGGQFRIARRAEVDDKDDALCLDDDDSMGEVNVSIVDRGAAEGEDDDDEDLLMDMEEDDGNGRSGEHRTAFEMNGEKVDSDHLRHVIETQIMNRHKAKIKDWDGTKGHMCTSCHETFLTENGLETHRNRRIHHILFFCRCCKRDLSFFNKCRLLQHLRNHRVTPTVTGLQNCTMIRLLPETEYLHFKYEDCTSSSDDEDKGGSGGGSGSSNPPKRPKPSRFRRVARSSLSGNGLDSPDHSPPPNITRQIVAPPQQLSATTTISSPPSLSSVITVSAAPATSSVSNAVGTIKYVTSASNGSQILQKRSEPVTVIKSTDSTTSVILPSSTVKAPPEGSPPLPKLIKQVQPSSSPTSASDFPQIRIRNLSQITVSLNDDEEDDQNGYGNGENLEVEPVVQIRPPVVKVTSQVQAPTDSAATSQTLTLHKGSPTTTQSQTVMVSKEYRCYKCDKRFNSNRDFFKHLEEQEAAGLSSRSLHRCPTDDIPSWSQCQYVFHTKVFHEQSVPFICPGCGDESPDYNTLMEHVTNNCFYLSLRVRYMCAASDQKCSFIDKKSVKTEPEIIDHLKKEHSRAVLQCVHCTQGFATDNWLLKHLGDAHKITCDESKGEADREALINKTTRPLTQCLICNILFPNGPTYLQHVYLNFHMHILHAKMLECQSCFAVFETTDDIMNHRKQSENCRKLDPFHMKISASANEHGTVSPSSQPTMMTPTPIKIVANPAMISENISIKTEQQHQIKEQVVQQRVSISNPTRSQPATVVTVISTANNANGAQASSQQFQRSQQKPLPTVQQRQVHCIQNSGQNSSRPMPSNLSARPGVPPANRSIAKKNFFDELQSCQFCERLVVFSSLRKHEDQCCGLSSVAPGFCLTCRNNFGDKKTLARHGIVHIQEGLPICLFCNNRHIRPTHPKSLTPSSHENLYALKKHLYSNHTSKAVQFPFQCPLCNKICNDKRTTEFHIKDHQFKYVKTDVDPVPLPTSSEDIQRLIKVRRKGVDPRRKVQKIIDVYYCPVCKNREFAQESGLARHLKLVHQKSAKSLNLSLLKKASSARRFVLKGPENAASPNTSIRPQLRSVSSSSDSRTRAGGTPSTIATRTSSNSSNVTISSYSPSTSFTSRFSSGVVLRKRIVAATSVVTGRKPSTSTTPQKAHLSPKLKTSTESPKEYRPPSNFLQTRSSTSPSKTVRKKDGSFLCLKCPDFSCKTENAFCEHIKWKHIWSETEIQKLQYGNKAGLEERSEYWCPECNTMFVAKTSLVRHLKSAHDYISNVEDYMQKIGYDGKKPLKPNQCEVCYYQCADDRELQQHIRTHGMAFLRLRQQRQMSMSKS